MIAVPIPGDYERLWSESHGRICQFVCSRVSNPEDAEDVLQEVFLRVHHHLGSVRDPGRLESWMYQIARNAIIDYYRRRRQWQDLPESVVEPQEMEEDPIAELLPAVKDLVLSLPEPYQDALILADFQGSTLQEIADKTGISLPGVKSRVQRARLKVKEALLRCYRFETDTRGQIMAFQKRCCC